MWPALPIPIDCPRCQRTLYPLRTLRPKYRLTVTAMLVTLAGGVVATAVFIGGGLAMFAILRGTPYEPMGRLLGLLPLVPAVLVGMPVVLAAYKLPRVVRLRCRQCGWSERFHKR